MTDVHLAEAKPDLKITTMALILALAAANHAHITANASQDVGRSVVERIQ